MKDWKRAKIFDFTGATGADSSIKEFGESVTKTLREPPEERLAIVLDTAYGLEGAAPVMVRDHINLSGFNPLIGPNHGIGERFPVVNDVYCPDDSNGLSLQKVVAAGVKTGRSVDSGDLEFIRSLGAHCYCFNLVPTMLIAAHAGWKIMAIIGPEGTDWQKDCLEKLGR
jgi:hypothetical protein